MSHLVEQYGSRWLVEKGMSGQVKSAVLENISAALVSQALPVGQAMKFIDTECRCMHNVCKLEVYLCRYYK